MSTITTEILERTATPPSYLKYNFDLPEKRYVGLLACQRDPLLTTLKSQVVRCEKVIPLAISSKGKKSKVVEEEKDTFEIQLLDTVLFPEGGGQPSDEGTLTDSTGKVVQVKQVLRKGLNAVHFTEEAMEVGATVQIDLNVEGRKDKMSQHTGQHLLSGVIDRALEVDTLSWSLTPYPTPCYIELARPLTSSEIESVQKECNRFISTGANVSVEMDLEAVIPSSVPSNYKDATEGGEIERKGVLRTVEIEGLEDRNPCCGTHYPSLSYLQALFILPHQAAIRGTNSRLFFIVGPRVISHLSLSHTIVRASALELACPASELTERVTLLQLNVRDSMRREKKLKEELAGFLAKETWEKACASEGVKCGVLFREEDATNSLEFLGSVSFGIKSRWEENDAKVGGESKALFALASGGSTPSTGSSLIFGSEELVMKAGKEMSILFGARLKGGGKGGRIQYKISGRWEKGDEVLLEKVIENACR